MARGHKTGGRNRGTPNKATAAKVAEIAASGETPLDYMINVMRDPDADPHRRDAAARAAAAYVHPKLASVEHTGIDSKPIDASQISEFEAVRRIAFAIELAREQAAGEDV